ncbi:MAG: hypothetical protein JNN13_07095 [Planctomycetes bacterium]|nr:hypothetical protein [Planctomycetota bacterium]
MTQRRSGGETGNALVMVLVVTIAISGLLYASLATTTVDLRASAQSLDDVRTTALAQAGVERTLDQLRGAGRKFNTINPMQGIQALFAGGTYTALAAAPIQVGSEVFGECSATATAVVSDAEHMVITIDSTGYYPFAPVHRPPGAPAPRRKSLRVTVEVDLEQSKVFDNSYFINNWGWFYGSNMFCRGNARSNGQFDIAGYSPTVTGQPTYDRLEWFGSTASLSGYRDDNADGLADGGDGGVFAGWDISGAQNLQGNGALAKNQHEFQDRIEMPNLSNLTMYEQRATAAGGTISVAGTTLVSGVYGDDAGEKQNLYLIGTAANPIVIDGPVVVRGDLVLAGVIKGQGAIYTGGNAYIPNNLSYANPPATSRPADNSQAATETWLAANKDKDFVAVLARENVVLGDHTNATWRSYVSGWLAHSMNKSREDAGEDGIPNTRLGKDGTAGTEDDDVLEDDGLFSVERYTTLDETLGLIPPGLTVGDVVPGSGEDIDGDGVYDDTLTLADLDLTAALDPANWGGTITGSVTYGSIASTSMARLDGVFYTNHAFAWLTLPSTAIQMNGALVSRNESIIYGGPSLNFNYDCRLLGGSASLIGDMLPRTLSPFWLHDWMVLDTDPNVGVVP